jgi:hypothetical protein
MEPASQLQVLSAKIRPISIGIVALRVVRLELPKIQVFARDSVLLIHFSIAVYVSSFVRLHGVLTKRVWTLAPQEMSANPHLDIFIPFFAAALILLNAQNIAPVSAQRSIKTRRKPASTPQHESLFIPSVTLDVSNRADRYQED